MAGGSGSLKLRQQLGTMSNGEIEAAMRASLVTAATSQAERLPDLAWEELKVRDRPRDADWAGACLAVAEQRYARGGYAYAAEAAAQAGSAYRRLEENLGGATCELLQAAALINLEQYAKALDLSDRAKAEFAGHGREADAALCDHLRGRSLSGVGLHQDALEAFEAEKRLLCACDERAEVARCDFERGRALQHLERDEEAIEAYRAARGLFVEAGSPADAAACETGRGIGLQRLGGYSEAIAAHEEAAHAFGRLGMPADAAACEFNRGVALHCLERYEDAITAYEAARPVLLEYKRIADAAACEAGRGAALDSLGEYARAVPAFHIAGSYYRTCRDFVEAARCDLERGNALQALGRYEEAAAAYKQGKAVYSGRGHIVEAAQCEANRGVALTRLGQYRKAMISFAAACPSSNSSSGRERSLGPSAGLRGAINRWATARRVSPLTWPPVIPSRPRSRRPAGKVGGSLTSRSSSLSRSCPRCFSTSNVPNGPWPMERPRRTRPPLSWRNANGAPDFAVIWSVVYAGDPWISLAAARSFWPTGGRSSASRSCSPGRCARRAGAVRPNRAGQRPTASSYESGLGSDWHGLRRICSPKMPRRPASSLAEFHPWAPSSAPSPGAKV